MSKNSVFLAPGVRVYEESEEDLCSEAKKKALCSDIRCSMAETEAGQVESVSKDTYKEWGGGGCGRKCVSNARFADRTSVVATFFTCAAPDAAPDTALRGESGVTSEHVR